MTKKEIAEKKLEVAKLRELAIFQRGLATSYDKQASKPIYAGQEFICTQKAAEVTALSNKNLAKAELIEAELIP